MTPPSTRDRRTERESFLAETRCGLLAVPEPARGPLAVPVRYHCAPGGVVPIVTGGSSLKARLLRAAGRASRCVQTGTPPYRHLSVDDGKAFG